MRTNVKKLVLMAMLAAIAFMMVSLIRIPVVLFLSYEPKDVIITVGGFLLGPMAAVIISAVVALVEMVTISTTGPIGCIMNMLSSICFACMAAAIYKKHRTMKGAVVGLIIGSVTTVVVMLLWNWLITPLYMGVSRQDVQALLIPAFLPFNALKVGFNTALTLALYKPLSNALRKTGLIDTRAGSAPASKAGVYLLAGGILLTCILLLLVLRGIL